MHSGLSCHQDLDMCLCRLEQAGLDSLGAVDLGNAIGSKFGIEVPATAAFNYPTASALAGHISTRVALSQVLNSSTVNVLGMISDVYCTIYRTALQTAASKHLAETLLCPDTYLC